MSPDNLRQKWINAIENANSSKFNQFGKICNLHFKLEDFGNSGILKKEAVPSVFTSKPLHSCEISKELETKNANLKKEVAHFKQLYENTKTVLVSERRKYLLISNENLNQSNEISEMSAEITSLKKQLKELREANQCEATVSRCLFYYICFEDSSLLN